MSVVMRCFVQMIREIRKDLMLVAACIGPVLAGIFFRFGIPAIEKWLVRLTEKNRILVPYYGLFDIALSVIAPVMFCFVAAMVVLEERDDKITRYLSVTGLGKYGYIVSRFGLMAVVSMVLDLILLPLFMLTKLSWWMVCFLSVAGALQGLIVGLMVVTFSSNKLEGMAVTKLSTMTVFGFVVPYFITHGVRYLLAPLPSFWAGQAVRDSNPVCMLLTVVVSFVWIYVLMRMFLKKE